MFKPQSTEDLLRFDLLLTKDGTEIKNRTFTWGRTYEEAYARTVATLDSEDGYWDGWSFELSKNGRQPR